MSKKEIVIKPHVLSFLVQAYCSKRRPNDFMHLVIWATKEEDKMAELMNHYQGLTRHEQRRFVGLCTKKAPDEAMRTVKKLSLLAKTVLKKPVTLKTRNGVTCHVARVSDAETMQGALNWLKQRYPKIDDPFVQSYAVNNYAFIFENETSRFGLIYHIEPHFFRKPQEALFDYFLAMWKNSPSPQIADLAAFYNDAYYDTNSRETQLIRKAIKKRLSPEILALL
jgi:hypothetical protein